MSGFFWNMRGFNKSKKHSIVRDWLQTESLQFGCLLETRVQETKAPRIISSVFRGWSSITNYEFNDLGRIWVVWKEDVRVTPVFKSGQVVTCSILLLGNTMEFFVSFVYAYNLAEERKELWEDLKSHFDSPLFTNQPWVIVGDFNEILDGAEHSTYDDNPFVTSGMRDFQDVSNLHWLLVGDKNNKFFHRAVQARQALNAIREILCQDGSIAKTQPEIKAEAVRFFEEFLTFEPNDYEGMSVSQLEELVSFRVSSPQHEGLLKLVSDEEIRHTLFKMPVGKSPGPDGYTVEFFKQAWSVIGRDFVVAVQSFFLKGFLPKGVNSTILTLIPKKSDSTEMKDYRPISCCNVLYKVVSKIIANRLKIILPSFIAPNQSAFIKDRLMMENLLLASELVKDYHKESISPRCMMKIDISKAFDSVQWPFLINILKAINVPANFIHWIELCICSASFSVQVNGELAGYFQSKRGLRQGCSLSPYLFVICMNVLSLMLDKAATDQFIGYHPRCKTMNLTHLCFADDILIFTDGSSHSIVATLAVFDRFAAVSGLRINLQKSSLFMAGFSTQHQHDILQHFQFSVGSLPVRYLGLPLLTRSMTHADYLPLLERIRSRISCWTGRFLSFAGRLQLIKSVLSSLTTFWFSAFRLPKRCLQEIDSLFSAFLWSGPALNTKKARISWLDVCKPMHEGGLGLRRLQDTNTVCILKLIWRLVSASTSLWVNWVRRNLIRTGSFFSVNERSVGGSWMWRKILKYRDLAANLHKKEISSGTDTSFWFDVWSPIGLLFAQLGNRGNIDMGIPQKSIVAEALLHRRRRHRVDILNQIEDALDSIRHSVHPQGSDRPLWKQRNGSFKSIFASYDTWCLIRQPNAPCAWSAGVWFTHSTPKYAFIAWLAHHNRLSTGDKLVQWNAAANGDCVLCQGCGETREHLFFSCSYSSNVWSTLVHNLLGARFTTSWTTLASLLVDSSTPRLPLFVLRYVFQSTIHSLWRERNARRHGEAPISSSTLCRFIDKQVRNRLLTLTSTSGYENGLQLWFRSHPLPTISVS
ncbi:PREDICTED: uncharacterized protein LOC104743817 [Camelina sativa]|uniref:Uncharacterized protein LOC104743817 n=1 Tax=Camelina sativa TaxID=90675 RepID=A0ABM0VYN2_CAMSA|nr:PREDICTED: uncharacterized protein LOC104743817 [Camelina sativa]